MENIRAGEPTGKSHRVMIRDSVSSGYGYLLFESEHFPLTKQCRTRADVYFRQKTSQEAHLMSRRQCFEIWGGEKNIRFKAFTAVALKITDNFSIVSQDNTMKLCIWYRTGKMFSFVCLVPQEGTNLWLYEDGWLESSPQVKPKPLHCPWWCVQILPLSVQDQIGKLWDEHPSLQQTKQLWQFFCNHSHIFHSNFKSHSICATALVDIQHFTFKYSYKVILSLAQWIQLGYTTSS